ncbi:MAG: hypothetical protein H0V41_09030 [Pseudonocardiales bacterium]|nr:hypothetical protein [Pseudonocardiales bacterium]
MTVRLDEAGLDDYTDGFEFEAFRQEVREQYDVPSDGGDFARYLAGEARPDPGVVEPWREWLREQCRSGRAVRRVRVLYGAPGRYVRYECEWAYTFSVDAGEDIRVLDLVEQEPPAGLIGEEFWLLDGSRAVVICYDDAGRFRHGLTAEGADASRWVTCRDAVWAAAEPFTQWWGRHPEYHRAAWLNRASA